MGKSTRAEFSYVIFFLAILCGYVFRLLPRNILLPGDVFMGLDVLRSAIYMELVLYWISSVKKRILYSAVRKYLLMIGYLLIFWLFIRTIKYLFLGNMDFLKSLCWTGAYILAPNFLLLKTPRNLHRLQLLFHAIYVPIDSFSCL